MPRHRKSVRELEPKLPVKLGPFCNGEIPPTARTESIRAAERLALERVEDAARRTGTSRREFLGTTCAAAVTLGAMNEALASEPFFHVTPSMQLDEAEARSLLDGDEFVFDVQTHHVNPQGAWRQGGDAGFRTTVQARCGEEDPIECLSAAHYVEEVFLKSDTQMAVLSAVPALPGNDPLTIQDAAATRELVERTQGSPRIQLHGLVVPNINTALQLDGMARLVDQYDIKAWKCYTHFGTATAAPWFLDDPLVGIPFIERARELEVRTICIHKGFAGQSVFGTCRDVGVVARRYPKMNFIIYHSGMEQLALEGPFNPSSTLGIDTLIASLRQNGIKPGSNVYAELGTTWRLALTAPETAAHILGKLVKAVGETNVLWGTDSIWHGSPQDQIQAFRAFAIPESMQERFGYLPLTPKRKERILGLNGAAVYGVEPATVAEGVRRDSIGRMRATGEAPLTTSFDTYGPRTRREFLDFIAMQGDHPA